MSYMEHIIAPEAEEGHSLNYLTDLTDLTN